MSKKPKVARTPNPRKQPSTGGVTPEKGGALAWRFGDADLGGDWGWRSFDGEQHLEELHRDLAAAERETRLALERGQRIKAIPAGDVCAEARGRLQAIGLDDEDTLWELRVATSRRPRVWGFVRGSVFHLLWWDPEHTVCPTGPKRGTRRR